MSESTQSLNGISQAQAMFDIMNAGYTPMSPLFQKGNNWTCTAGNNQNQQMYAVTVDNNHNVSAKPMA
jgi:hypothetical protein